MTKRDIQIKKLLYFQGGRGCDYDSFKIFGGQDDTSPSLTSICGNKQMHNVTVESMGNHMFVRFKSDGSIRGKGFKATFSSQEGGCGGRMTAPSGKKGKENKCPPTFCQLILLI